MRKRTSIDALFPKVRQGLLAATVMHPDRWWSMSDLARDLHVGPSSLQRELESLVKAGILLRRKDQNRVLFQPDPACPFLQEIRGLMTKTSGLVDVLKDAMRALEKSIDCAFVYGSFARGDAGSQSDVDLMVVGKAGLSDLAPYLQKVERKLSRPVNATVFTPSELAVKKKNRDNFVTTVLSGKKNLCCRWSR